MTALLGLLDWVGRKISLVLAGGLLLSLFIPDLGPIGPLLLSFAVTGTLTIAMVRIDLSRVKHQWRRPDRIFIVLVFLMVVMPVGLAYLSPAVGLPATLALLLVLLAASPPIASGANYAFFIGLDGELAINLLVVGTLAMPFVAPALLFNVLDLGLDVDVWQVFRTLAATVFLAIFFAAVIRTWAGRERIVKHAKAVEGIAGIWMIVFLIAIMNGIGALALSDPLGILTLLALAVFANFGFPLLSLGLVYFLPQAQNHSVAKSLATVAMFSGNRNIGLVLTALPAGNYADVAPFVAVFQIPMYLTPLLMGPHYRRFIGRFDPEPCVIR